MSVSFIIKTNASQATDVLIHDMGIVIPASGGSETLVTQGDLDSARLSRDLLTLCTDDAYGSGSSTLILNDGTSDILQIFAADIISNAAISGTGSFKRYLNLSSTGLVAGGVLTVNTNPTKFDIASGSGIVVNNYTDSTDPTYSSVYWDAQSAVTPTYLASSDITYIGVDASSNIIQQTSPFTSSQKRDIILIGALVHPSRVVVTGTSSETGPLYDVNLAIADFATSLGAFNITGNIFSANGTNLKIDKSAGTVYKYGGNYFTNAKTPHITELNASSEQTWFYLYQNGSGGWTYSSPTSDADPDLYDDGSGTLASVPTDNWTIQYIFMFPENGSVQIQYGQSVYTSIDDAKSQLGAFPSVSPSVSAAIFRGWLVVKEGTTALDNTSVAEFVPAGKLGLISDIGSASGGEVNTASNVGTAGIGLYLQKLGVDLQFKNIKATSSKVLVENNVPDNTVQIDIVPGNISHTGIADIGTNTHPQIDSHISSTLNPHSVTKTQVGLGNVTDDAQLKRAAADFTTFTTKAIPVGADVLLIEDSADSSNKKKIAISTLGPSLQVFPRYHYYADQMDFPVNSDWAVNAYAPIAAGSINPALVVRRFDDTAEEGIGFTLELPTAATNIIFYIKSKAQTAPGAARQVILRLYKRDIPDNAAVGSWSAATQLTAIDIPTNAFFQYDSQTISFASLGLTAGRATQFEITRYGGSGSDTLVGDWNLLLMRVEFS